MEAHTPRPHPRFAGADVLIAHGAEMVQKGASSGQTGLIVGGVFLILLGVVLVVVWCCRVAIMAWIRQRLPAPSPTPEESEGGLVVAVPLQGRPSHEGSSESGGQRSTPPPLVVTADVHVGAAAEPAAVTYGSPSTLQTYL